MENNHEVTDQDISNLASKISPQDMYRIAIQFLDISLVEVDHAEKSSQNNTWKFGIKCFHIWKKRYAGPNMKEDLYRCLSKAADKGLIGRDQFIFLRSNNNHMELSTLDTRRDVEDLEKQIALSVIKEEKDGAIPFVDLLKLSSSISSDHMEEAAIIFEIPKTEFQLHRKLVHQQLMFTLLCSWWRNEPSRETDETNTDKRHKLYEKLVIAEKRCLIDSDTLQYLRTQLKIDQNYQPITACVQLLLESQSEPLTKQEPEDQIVPVFTSLESQPRDLVNNSEPPPDGLDYVDSEAETSESDLRQRPGSFREYIAQQCSNLWSCTVCSKYKERRRRTGCTFHAQTLNNTESSDFQKIEVNKKNEYDDPGSTQIENEILERICSVSEIYEEIAPEFIYDAYVTYSPEDEDWVREELVPCLEEEYGLRLCVRYRNFVAGCSSSTSAIRSMSQSRKIIQIISEAATESQLYLEEVYLAHLDPLLLKDPARILCAVMPETNIDSLPDLVRDYLSTYSYTQLKDDWALKKLTVATGLPVFEN